MSQENKVPTYSGIEFRGGKQIQHVKPVSGSQNQSGSTGGSSGQSSPKK
jgi:hypothetical protein